MNPKESLVIGLIFLTLQIVAYTSVVIYVFKHTH